MSSAANKIQDKMEAAGMAEPVIRAFLNAHAAVMDGATGLIPESTIQPVETLPELDTVRSSLTVTPDLLNQLAVVKLNGGLGTSMGLNLPKSLIKVKDEDNFLDFIARQVIHLRENLGAPNLAFYLMNSFNTRDGTLEYLKKYPQLPRDGEVDFVQSKVPKILEETGEPVSWPSRTELEWCPPGHGDLYPSLMGCGLLKTLLARGIRYLFVSNADNLGATVDPALLQYFADSGLSFLMEVARRTPTDRKGGHLACRQEDGRLLLRESAQCPKGDVDQFQDIETHRYFNTNNLWVQLEHLQQELDRQGGVLTLPLITNHKTVDPRDPDSPAVVQIECAMGAAIECFQKSGAIQVPRSRFSPVKTTGDLLALRSDAYTVSEEHCLVVDPDRHGQPPVVQLDDHYKRLEDFEARFPQGAPSLKHCDRLSVKGDVTFAGDVICRGAVDLDYTGKDAIQLSGILGEG